MLLSFLKNTSQAKKIECMKLRCNKKVKLSVISVGA